MTSTYTYALVEVSKATFDEIASKLKESGIYDHAFHDDGKVIDMHGLALKVVPELKETKDSLV